MPNIKGRRKQKKVWTKETAFENRSSESQHLSKGYYSGFSLLHNVGLSGGID